MRLLALAACSIVVAILAAAVPAAPSTHAAWTGRNGHIAFASLSAPKGIGQMDSDGSHRKMLTNGADTRPSWDTSGNGLLFEHGSGLYLFQPEEQGNTPTLVAQGSGPSWRVPTFGFGYVYSAAGDIQFFDGSTTINVTQTPGITDLEPVMSPDGLLVAYSSNEEPGGDPDNPVAGLNFNLWLTDGTDRQILWENDSGTYQGAPDWAPDGSRIAFADNGDIWTTPPDGNNQTNLTNDAETQTFPTWSPDGLLVAYVQETGAQPAAFGDNGDGGEIWTIDVDTRDRVNLTNNPNAHDSMPDWQPIPRSSEIWGDTLCSGLVDVTDALALLVYDSGITMIAPTGCPAIGAFTETTQTGDAQPSGLRGGWGDFDCSFSQTPQDALIVLAYIAGVPYQADVARAGIQCTPIGDLANIPTPL